MMLGKLVFFLIIAALVYWLIKARSSEETENIDEKTEEDAENNASPKALEEMVRCVHCGVHLPRSESVTSQGDFFCCNEHRIEHQDSDTST
jgi:uncharacterized protein